MGRILAKEADRKGAQLKMRDSKLFVKIKKKDKEAFMEAYDLYVDDIHRFIYFKVGNGEEANDITSSVFLKTWEYILKENIDKERSLKALIYRIARNAVIDHYRKASQKDVGINDGEAERLPDEKEDLEARLELDSEMERVKNALPKIKDEYREILVMKYINEMSFAEIAEATGKSRGNARVISYRALKALREVLDKGSS